jgi:triacylglycerol esterase/lipase EstA (alpha/beta hydrolase family)
MPNRKASAAGKNDSATGKRCHIVFIPGFGGFDALGGVNYYAGVTELFQDWTHDHDQHWTADDPDVALHYFDNLPTAAVVTRAQRLRNYLAKRMARGEIRCDRDDDIILIGHSTGGLDIRRLICDLDLGRAMNAQIRVDGVHHRAIEPGELRRCIKRVVFLSVPH